MSRPSCSKQHSASPARPGAKGHDSCETQPVKSASGVVRVVQEQRFLLASDDGPWLHFILAAGAPLGGRDLQALQQAGRVAVRYDDAPDMIGHVAHDVVMESST